MPLALALATMQDEVQQCDNLVAACHRQDSDGVYLFSDADREQITAAAFLNVFKAWESFLEVALSEIMTGESTITGGSPTKYVSPRDKDASIAMLKGTQRFFDFANHHSVRKIVSLFFDQGYPFEPHLGSVVGDLDDIRTIRNACAHISISTQRPLETLAMRLLGRPQSGITVRQLLLSILPRDTTGATVFTYYRDKLLLVAELIANG